ncbi:alpha/beta fold hydrolase [Marinobacter pelagius]|uniref:alpha/beta fold hydrolase n=1 Tax=Marinobacter sp. C7 TaxID=2951363 RepID=UPI001EF0B47B|nr:alpha/beta fold hydrolase [Marinobacter sp. C7]MCG7199928.1 alpha/beta fold hydrolase [Marinobacter sp. C7]
MPFVQNQDVSIYFEDTGEGMPLVLGHSFLCSGKMWREQVPALANHYRVVNVDFRGHGRSGEVKQPFTLYDAVSDVVAVLDECGIEKAIWCGLSVGGMVAMRAAITRPERVAGLILLDTDAGAEHPFRKLKYHLMGMGARALGIKPFLSPISRLMFGASTRRQKRALVSEWKDEFATVHVPSILRSLEGLMQRDSVLARLPEISVPSLVVVGEEDQSLPPAASRQIHERLPNSTFAEIPGAGHLSTLEQPEAVNRAILDFLETSF